MHAISKYIIPLAFAAGMVVAAPVVDKREFYVSNYGDANILQYALTLEHLERAFYRDSLNRFSAADFAAAGKQDFVRQRFTEIASHERDHVAFLTAGLTAAGATPVPECTYIFDSIITSVDAFIAYSQILEGVGVAAYLGAAPSISNKQYLGYAASILTVETEHHTWVDSAINMRDGFPRAFAAPLDFNQVYSLAAPFISSCPAGAPALPFASFPALTIANPKTLYHAGDVVQFSFDQSIVNTANSKGQTLYAAFVSAVGTQYVALSGDQGSVTIPQAIEGQSYLIITNGPYTCDPATVAGPAILNVDLQAANVDYS